MSKKWKLRSLSFKVFSRDNERISEGLTKDSLVTFCYEMKISIGERLSRKLLFNSVFGGRKLKIYALAGLSEVGRGRGIASSCLELDQDIARGNGMGRLCKVATWPETTENLARLTPQSPYRFLLIFNFC
jgi:hypothetical protein